MPQVFSRTENGILGALSRLEDFLMNPLFQSHSGTDPETSRNANVTNKGTNENDSQSDPHPESSIFHIQTTRNSGPEDGHDSLRPRVFCSWRALGQSIPLLTMPEAGPTETFHQVKSISNCLLSGSVTTLICLATSSDASGVLWVPLALLTSTSSCPVKLRVSSLFSAVVIPSLIGSLMSSCRRFLKLKLQLSKESL